MAKTKEEKPLFAVQKGKKYNPKNLNGKIDKRFRNGYELKIWEKEKLYVKRTPKQLMSEVVENINNDHENKITFAPLVLQILCSVGGACHITELTEMFTMYAGHTASKQDFLTALNKLQKLSIVSTGTVAQGPKKTVQSLPVNGLEFVYVTFFGTMVAHNTVCRGMQLIPTNLRQMRVPAVKANVQAVCFINRLLKMKMLSNFRCRPVFVKKTKKNRRTRFIACKPAFVFNMKGEQVLYYNCRKRKGWLKSIINELERASVIFSKRTPVIIVAAEDMFMTSEVFKAIMKKNRIKANIIFTDDEALCKAKDKNFLYLLTADKNKIVKKVL